MAAPLALKDRYRENTIFRQRLAWIASAIVVLSFLLVSRYFYLQIIRYRAFTSRAEANRVLTEPITPTRGLIVDRNGEILADNRPSFSLNIVKERTNNLNDTFEVLRQLVQISDEEIDKYRERLKQRDHKAFQSVPLRYRLTEEEMATIAVNEWRLPGVEIQAQLVRNYPKGELFAHSIGYVGSISDKDLDELADNDALSLYQGVFSIGKLGLERVYERNLFGTPGAQNIETDAHGRMLRALPGTLPPKPGDKLTLFLDTQLQQLAMDQLKGKRAAVVAIEVKTGGVVVAVSTPSFDPNLFVTGISTKDYNALRDDWQVPLLNRMLQGQYPPGSTIKPLMGLTGLENNIITPQFAIADHGYFQLPNDERLYRDWKKEGHGGSVNLHQAIAESCDTYFFTLGYKMGVDRIDDMFRQFGFGNKTGVDLTTEKSGVLPTREWKKARTRLPWFPGDTLNMSIGQGDMLVTPMQLAYATTIIASRGHRIVPRLVKQINDVTVPAVELEPVTLHQSNNWDPIFNGMMAVIHGPHGTASGIAHGLRYHMAGKTGTAQVIGIKQNEKYNAALVALRKRDHALFISFAPVEDPQIAVAVVVENGEHGSSGAAPIARAVLDGYLLTDKINPAKAGNKSDSSQTHDSIDDE